MLNSTYDQRERLDRQEAELASGGGGGGGDIDGRLNPHGEVRTARPAQAHTTLSNIMGVSVDTLVREP